MIILNVNCKFTAVAGRGVRKWAERGEVGITFQGDSLSIHCEAPTVTLRAAVPALCCGLHQEV